MDEYRQLVGIIGLAIESVGVVVIVAGALLACWRYLRPARPGGLDSYHQLRVDLGRSILLGLEFLIAGDIIRTVAVTPSLENVALLGLIVVIRTFLSVALQVEVEGCWPWRVRANSHPPPEPR